MFEMRQVDDLEQILTAGGGIELRGGMKSTADLIRLAAAAKRGGAHLYLRGMGMRSTAEVVSIARAGQGAVVFADNLPKSD